MSSAVWANSTASPYCFRLSITSVSLLHNLSLVRTLLLFTAMGIAWSYGLHTNRQNILKGLNDKLRLILNFICVVLVNLSWDHYKDTTSQDWYLFYRYHGYLLDEGLGLDNGEIFFWKVVLSRTYPVEGGSLIPAVAAVEENVSCSFQKLEDESGVSGS